MAAQVIPNSDITIYNRYIDAGTRSEKYARVVVKRVVWQATKAISGGKSGALASNIATVFIPMQRGADYVTPIAWQALTDKTGKWTLQDGDVIVRNAVSDEITAATTDPETEIVTPAFTMTSLRAKYEDVVTITSIDCMDQGSANVQHWQVGCK